MLCYLDLVAAAVVLGSMIVLVFVLLLWLVWFVIWLVGLVAI